MTRVSKTFSGSSILSSPVEHYQNMVVFFLLVLSVESLTLKEFVNKITQVTFKYSITERQYQRLEAGDSKPTYDNLISIAMFYNVSIDFLVGRTNNPNISCCKFYCCIGQMSYFALCFGIILSAIVCKIIESKIHPTNAIAYFPNIILSAFFDDQLLSIV